MRRERRAEQRAQALRAVADGEYELFEVGRTGREPGDQLVPEQIAPGREIAVGGVADRVDALLGQEGLDRGAWNAQERTEKRAAPLGDPRQALEPGAGEQAEQDGLDLVVALVGGQDAGRAGRGADLLERFVTDPACGDLGALAAPTLGGDVARDEPEGEPEPVGESGRLCRALCGAGVEAMIEVDEQEPESGARREGSKPGRERGRVGPARKGDQPEVARRGALPLERERELAAQDLGGGVDRRTVVPVGGIEPPT